MLFLGRVEDKKHAAADARVLREREHVALRAHVRDLVLGDHCRLRHGFEGEDLARVAPPHLGPWHLGAVPPRRASRENKQLCECERVTERPRRPPRTRGFYASRGHGGSFVSVCGRLSVLDHRALSTPAEDRSLLTSLSALAEDKAPRHPPLRENATPPAHEPHLAERAAADERQGLKVRGRQPPLHELLRVLDGLTVVALEADACVAEIFGKLCAVGVAHRSTRA